MILARGGFLKDLELEAEFRNSVANLFSVSPATSLEEECFNCCFIYLSGVFLLRNRQDFGCAFVLFLAGL